MTVGLIFDCNNRFVKNNLFVLALDINIHITLNVLIFIFKTRGVGIECNIFIKYALYFYNFENNFVKL